MNWKTPRWRTNNLWWKQSIKKEQFVKEMFVNLLFEYFFILNKWFCSSQSELNSFPINLRLKNFLLSFLRSVKQWFNQTTFLNCWWEFELEIFELLCETRVNEDKNSEEKKRSLASLPVPWSAASVASSRSSGHRMRSGRASPVCCIHSAICWAVLL